MLPKSDRLLGSEIACHALPHAKPRFDVVADDRPVHVTKAHLEPRDATHVDVVHEASFRREVAVELAVFEQQFAFAPVRGKDSGFVTLQTLGRCQ